MASSQQPQTTNGQTILLVFKDVGLNPAEATIEIRQELTDHQKAMIFNGAIPGLFFLYCHLLNIYS